MKNDEKKNISILIYTMIPSIAVSFFWLLLGHKISEPGYFGTSEMKQVVFSNIAIYVVAMFLFISCFFVMHLIVKNKISAQKTIRDNTIPFIGIVLYICSLVFLIAVLLIDEKFVVVKQSTYLFRNTLWFPIYLLFLVLTVNIFTFLVIPNDTKKNKWFRLSLIVTLAILVVFLTFTSNPFGDLGGGAWHFDAYINSIMNTDNFVPYSYEVNSIYGHYGIFYIIPVKILSYITPTKWHAISLSIAIVGGITYILFSCVLNRIIKRDSIFFLAMLAIGIWSFGFSRGNYYQNFPHRCFFQAIIIFFLMKLIEAPSSKYRKAIVILMASASIVWNVETGIICAIVCCTCLFVLRYLKSIKIYYNFMLSAVEFVLVLFLSYLTVAIYNISTGGGLLSVKEYVYPLGSEDYHVIDMLQLPMDIPISLFYVYFIVLIGVFCICGIKIIGRQANIITLVSCLCSIMGLGVFPYYINRVCFSNIHIATPMVFILIAIIVDNCGSLNVIENIKRIDSVKSILGKFALYVLVIFAMDSIMNLSYIISYKNESSYSNYQLQQLINQVGELPEGTNVIGDLTSVFCMCVSEGNIIYTMDWADMHEAGKEYCYNEIMKNEDITYLVSYNNSLDDVMNMFSNASVVDNYVYSDNNGVKYEWFLVDLGRDL